MSITLSIAIYFMIWWIILFAVIPCVTNNKNNDIINKNVQIKKVFFINTIVSFIIFIIIWLIYKLFL